MAINLDLSSKVIVKNEISTVFKVGMFDFIQKCTYVRLIS